jgi:hypothetical protein
MAKISQEQRDRDARKAMADYAAQVQATRDKTERLRELRLARESAGKAAKPAAAEITAKDDARSK